MSYLINGGFPQTMHSYINVRQPLRLELFEQHNSKMKKAQEDAKDPKKAIALLNKTLKFSSDNAFGYKDKKIMNPNTNEDPNVHN
tara:strand:+ start:1266 stop:1520 length:255 start_codon:yes stop_codon:yes gene_type:complete